MRKNKKNIVHNRIFDLAIVLFILFALLAVRLYWIQVNNHDRFKMEALRQRGERINLYPNRGIIYDMNLIPLTNSNTEQTAFVSRYSINNNKEVREFLIKNADITITEFNRYINSNEAILAIPLRYPIDNTNRFKDVFIAEKTSRYSDNNILSHVIGYINESENRGECGVEKVYDEVLINQISSNSLYLEFDESKGIFLDGDYVVSRDTNSIEPNAVKLTIDYHIQKLVEEILDEYKVNGAVIVADIESGEIRALASRPNFNQDNIDEYLDRNDMALYNKAVQVGYPPGSIFKIVVLLTALDEDINYLDRTFYCKGYEEVGNNIIDCNKVGGHGIINLSQAFSQSCNAAFIQLGKELGSAKIMDMAERLGLGEKVNIGLLEEVAGSLPQGEELLGPAIGNISIGQGSIESTPVQITNLMMIIANDGINKGLSIVDGITSQNGLMIKKFNKEKERRVVSKSNCKIVKDYLKHVVWDGTASNLYLDDIGGAAGKTGSAQAVSKGKETIHGWFTGFYPSNEPRYVVTVLVEDSVSGSQSAVPIFEKIVREINNINR